MSGTPISVGRNDPCPCGSGKKFKKCCADKGARPPTPPVANEQLYAQARQREASGNVEAAKGAYLAFLETAPNHFGALTSLAALFARVGDRETALALFEKGVEVAPKNPNAHVNLALAVAQFYDDTERARTHYELALRLDPHHREAHKGLAFALLRLGKTDAAVKHGRIGFRDGAEASPFRGQGKPPSILLLKSALQNIAIDGAIDERRFQKWTVIVEFFDPSARLPRHDLVLNCVGDPDLYRGEATLDAVEAVVARTRARVLNPPSRIRPTGRAENAKRLRALDGVVTAETAAWPRTSLEAADAVDALARAGFTFPLLVRSPGHQTGHHFVKIDAAADLPNAIAALPGDELLVMQFVDTRSADGRFRKYRALFIGGEIYPLHLAVSSKWKVHYFSADMADHPEHRAEDDAFLRDMNGALGPSVVATLERIRDLLALDYGGIDFAVAGGKVVVFEANASMLIAPVGADPRWAYRVPAVARAREAVQRLLQPDVVAP